MSQRRSINLLLSPAASTLPKTNPAVQDPLGTDSNSRHLSGNPPNSQYTRRYFCILRSLESDSSYINSLPLCSSGYATLSMALVFPSPCPDDCCAFEDRDVSYGFLVYISFLVAAERPTRPTHGWVWMYFSTTRNSDQFFSTSFNVYCDHKKRRRFLDPCDTTY